MRGCSSASAAPFCHGATVLNPPGREKTLILTPGCRASALSSRLPRGALQGRS